MFKITVNVFDLVYLIIIIGVILIIGVAYCVEKLIKKFRRKV